MFLFITPNFVFANESEKNDLNASNTGAVLNDNSLSISDELKLNKLAQQKDKSLESSLSEDFGVKANPDGEYYLISVTNFAQENGYYCGPASVRQSLSFHKSKIGSSTSLPSQSTLASKIGTTTNGSTTSGIAKGLNAYKSTFGFSGNPYVAADLTNVSNPRSTFETRIKGVLRNRTNAPIVLLQTKYLPRYSGKSIRHYNTISGYSHNYSTGSKKMRTVDPHYNSTYRGIRWDPVGSTTSNGVFRAVYEADKAGTNKAMAY